jgi:hypothetical protein
MLVTYIIGNCTSCFEAGRKHKFINFVNSHNTHSENMANITLSIPENLYQLIKKHKEVKWSEIARQAMWEYAQKLELLESIVKKSKLTKKDIRVLDKKIKAGILKRHLKEIK